MSAPIPTGTVINYSSGDWHTESYFLSPDDIVSQVSQKLSADGIKVLSSSTNVGVGASAEGVVTGDIQFGVTLQVQVLGGLGYSQASDIASVIDHDVYVVTGYLPASSSVPSYSLPNNSSVAGILSQIGALFTGNKTTGQPASTNSSPSFLDSLTSKGTLYIALAIFGFIGGLLLIGYSGALREHV